MCGVWREIWDVRSNGRKGKRKRMKITRKTKRVTVARVLTDAAMAHSFGSNPGARVKTSIIVQQSLMRQAQELARVMGVSYNGFINLAIYEKIHAHDGE